MAILNFSDVLMKVGLDPKNVKLIRHALSDEQFRECYEAGMALGRWSVYAATSGHGNNKGMIEHFNAPNHSCHDV